MLAGMYRGPGSDDVAWNSALLYDMILTQPVVHALPDLRVPTPLMIGDRDITAIGSDTAPPAIRATLGHSPQMQDPNAFHTALLAGLSTPLP
ncbi:MAG: hypothetical protein ABF665_12470 [Gluconacetobacter sp.]